MNCAQLTKAIADVREMMAEVYNDHVEMKAQITELRIAAGLVDPSKSAKKAVSPRRITRKHV